MSLFLNYFIFSDDKEEVVAQPMKFDGYYYRTVEEDTKHEEMGGTKQNMKKQTKKK